MSTQLGVESLHLTHHDRPNHQTSPPRRHHGNCAADIDQNVQPDISAQLNGQIQGLWSDPWVRSGLPPTRASPSEGGGGVGLNGPGCQAVGYPPWHLLRYQHGPCTRCTTPSFSPWRCRPGDICCPACHRTRARSAPTGTTARRAQQLGRGVKFATLTDDHKVGLPPSSPL
jgi:hypothetical protein